MANDMTQCLLCASQIIDTAYACTQCAGDTRRALQHAAALFPEFAIAIARLARFGEPTRFATTEAPLPFNISASIDYGSVLNTITTWALHIQAERGNTAPNPGSALILWLAGQTDWIRYRQEADQALDELGYAARLVVRAIDAPAVHWYAGPCDDCAEGLYARTGAEVITCHSEGCYAVYDAAERKRWLLLEAHDVLANAAEIARLVSAMRGDLVTSASVRGLAHRGRFIAHGVDRNGRPTYRVGDVLAVLRDGRVAA